MSGGVWRNTVRKAHTDFVRRVWNNGRVILAVCDVVLVSASVLLSVAFRFEFRVPPQVWSNTLRILPLHAIGTLVLFSGMGMYRQLWHYATAQDLILVVEACIVSTLLLFFLAFVWPLHGFSRAAVLGAGPLMMATVGGVRYGIRLRGEGMAKAISSGPHMLLRSFARVARVVNGAGGNGDHERSDHERGVPDDDAVVRGEGSEDGNGRCKRAPRVRAIIVGAGAGGLVALRELRTHPEVAEVIGFIDDDPTKQYAFVNGVPVLGGIDDIPRVADECDVRMAIIAMPSAPPSAKAHAASLARSAGLEVKILPAVYDLIAATTDVATMRDFDVEDLLQREPVRVDVDAIAGYLRGMRVLVTGGAGSIGFEICRQVARMGPARLILLDHAENAVFESAFRLRREFESLDLVEVVADIRDRMRMEALFDAYKPDVVFHAAAYKHVPMMELHPVEAVKTNVFGTYNVAKCCLRHGARKLVYISTDKAVNPTSVMGATKRVGEMIIQRLNQGTDPMQGVSCSTTRGVARCAMMCVRFGNVLGSQGSVVPLFKEQIRNGGPVTVTDPEMRRYFMTIPEAVQLVIQAGAMGKGGEVFVLDMGEPVRVLDLAHQMIRLQGYEPERDIPIKIIGRRPGEKLYEELLTAEEGVSATPHERIWIANNCSAWSTNGRHVQFDEELRYLEQAVFRERNGRTSIISGLQRLVPSYRPDGVVTESERGVQTRSG